MRITVVLALSCLFLFAGPAVAEEPLTPLRLSADDSLNNPFEMPSSEPRTKVFLKLRRDTDPLTERLYPQRSEELEFLVGAEYQLTSRFSIGGEVARPADEVPKFIREGFSSSEKERGSSFSFNPFKAKQMIRFKYRF